MSFNHVVAQGEAHSGRQRVHDIFHPSAASSFTTPQRSQINMAELWVGWSKMTQHIAVGRFHLVDKTLLE